MSSFVLTGEELQKQFNIEKYTGLWFDVAHSPVWYLKDSNFGTTAKYTLRPTEKCKQEKKKNAQEEKCLVLDVENVTFRKTTAIPPIGRESKVKRTSVTGTATQVGNSTSFNVRFSPLNYKGSSLLQKGLNAAENLFQSKKKANYVILGVGLGDSSQDPYTWACVGDNKSKDCFVLSRTKSLPPDLKEIYKILQNSGFVLENLVFTDQSEE
jgi:lipocalin